MSDYSPFPARYETTHVYKIGSTYYAEKYDGTLVSTSGTFETVLQAALDLAGLIVIDQDGTFPISSAGVDIKESHTTLRMGPNTNIQVPDGYSSYIIKLQEDTNANLKNCHVIGGRLTESGTSQTVDRLWTGIKIKGAGAATFRGIGFSSIRDVYMENPGIGVHLDATDGWINGNIFKDITMFPAVIGFDFDAPTPVTDINKAIQRSEFENCVIQDADVQGIGHIVQTGFRNIRHRDLAFRGCKVWDLATPSTQKTATIHQDALLLTITGGIMGYTTGTSNFFTDNGRSSFIFDEWHAPSYGGFVLQPHKFALNGRKFGKYDSPSTTFGEGLFGGVLTNAATESPAGGTVVVTFSDGTVGRTRTTGTTSGNTCGVRSIQDTTCRGWNPIYRILFKLSQTSNTRPYFGWASATADLTGDDPLNVTSGVMLSARAADTNFQIASNNAFGATVFTSTGIAMDTNIKIFELFAQDLLTNKWKWALYDASKIASWPQSTSLPTYTELTTAEIPTQTTALRPFFQMSTGENAAKSMTIYQVYIESD